VGDREAFGVKLVIIDGALEAPAIFVEIRRAHHSASSRTDTDLAWAGSPSAWASATAAGPIAARPAGPSCRKLVRFMKSSTERPDAKRARRPVGRTWFGPAT